MTLEGKREYWLTVRVEGKTAAEALIRQMMSERRTGSLTINFSQGGIATAEWRQREKEQNDNPNQGKD